MRRLVAGTLFLAALYLMTLVSADPLDLLVGVVLGATIMLLLGRRLRAGRPAEAAGSIVARTLWFPVFAGAVLVDVARGTWDVALRVLPVRRLEHPGIVCVPIGDRSERGVAVSALAITLSPGSVLLDVDWEKREMQWHVIDASDPDAVRDGIQRFYERYQRRVFP